MAQKHKHHHVPITLDSYFVDHTGDFVAFEGKKKLAYSIIFENASPFVNSEKVIDVPNGGLSPEYKVDRTAAEQTFVYSVEFPALKAGYDPEIRVGSEETLWVTLRLPDFDCEPPKDARPGDLVGFRLFDQNGEAGPKFSIKFTDKDPFVDAPRTIKSKDDGTTLSYELAPLSSRSPETFTFLLSMPKLERKRRPVGTLTVYPPGTRSRRSSVAGGKLRRSRSGRP